MPEHNFVEACSGQKQKEEPSMLTPFLPSGTQVNFYAKCGTSHSVQTEGSELPPGSSSTASSSGHSTSNHATVTTTTPVPPLNPALVPAMSPHASDSEEEKDDDDDNNEDDEDRGDPLYEPFVEKGSVE